MLFLASLAAVLIVNCPLSDRPPIVVVSIAETTVFLYYTGKPVDPTILRLEFKHLRVEDASHYTVFRLICFQYLALISLANTAALLVLKGLLPLMIARLLLIKVHFRVIRTFTFEFSNSHGPLQFPSGKGGTGHSDRLALQQHIDSIS